MTRLMGVIYAAVAAVIIVLAPLPAAQAAPVYAGTGSAIRDTVPSLTTEVRWHGGRGWRRGGYRPYRAYYRPYRRPYYARPYYWGRPAYYGPACFIRPARWVWTPYGQQFRPARRVCRY